MRRWKKLKLKSNPNSGVVQFVAHGALEPRILVRVQAPEPIPFLPFVETHSSILWKTAKSSSNDRACSEIKSWTENPHGSANPENAASPGKTHNAVRRPFPLFRARSHPENSRCKPASLARPLNLP